MRSRVISTLTGDNDHGFERAMSTPERNTIASATRLSSDMKGALGLVISVFPPGGWGTCVSGIGSTMGRDPTQRTWPITDPQLAESNAEPSSEAMGSAGRIGWTGRGGSLVRINHTRAAVIRTKKT